MERNYSDVQLERERRIAISKLNGDYYRELSWERNSNPSLTQPNTLPSNNKKYKQEYVDDVLIKK